MIPLSRLNQSERKVIDVKWRWLAFKRSFANWNRFCKNAHQTNAHVFPLIIAEDQSRKREIRLQKNREAARECRRKKKEYIKCLENRVAVLENQNKALIEELKSLKELYCQQKTDWEMTSSPSSSVTILKSFETPFKIENKIRNCRCERDELRRMQYSVVFFYVFSNC